MRKKILIVTGITYALLVGFLYLYLFVLDTAKLPNEFIGTVADPQTFLTERELLLTEEYSNIRNFLFFLEIPYEWIFYGIILLFGINKRFANWSELTTKFQIFRSAIFTFCLNFITYLAFFPIRFIRYYFSKEYGVSTQTFHSWMRDVVIDFWLDWLILFSIVTVLYWLIRKTKKWWLYAWLLSIPFAIFLVYIQPVVIDPLYNDFYSLKNKELEKSVLSLAQQANIPAEHVYEVNMSEKTNALNAYVTGIGSNARIVFWDTTLERLNEDEVLFIVAHEMAHYVEKHIYIGMASYLTILLLGLYLTSRIVQWVIRKFGDLFQISSIQSFASLPLILLVFSVLTFSISPFENAFSRKLESRADQYAIELTMNSEAGVSTFQELTRAGLSQVNPPTLVKWFRYGHPTMLERITFINQYHNEEE